MKPFAIAEQVKDRAEQAGLHTAASPWVENLARFGYAIRGILYAIVGLLAVQVAIGHGGATTDKGGAITAIGGEPFGKLLLVLVAIGLVGYAIWGFVRAIVDPLGRGNDAKGVAQRVGYAISGLSYGALVLPTIRAITGSGGTSGGNGSSDMTAGLLHAPFGPWLVGLIGLIATAGGFGQMYQAYNGGFKKDFKAWEMSADTMRIATFVARFGLVARGIIFALGGFFLIQAALHVDPKQARGLDGTLAALAAQPYGPWLLGAVALGLVAFGCYSLICARYIRIRKAR